MSLSRPIHVHVLGLGNLGRLFAHALATHPTPPNITLLFHRPSLLEEWEAAHHSIRIDSKSEPPSTSTSSNYTTELVVDPEPSGSRGHSCPTSIPPSARSEANSRAKSTPDIIKHLIVATKAPDTVRALRPLVQRLNGSSTLLFVQNGMGTVDEVSEAYYPSPTRPRCLAAATSHGLYSSGPFHSMHAGVGTMAIGQAWPDAAAPSDAVADEAKRSGSLLALTTSSPLLNASPVPGRELFHLALEKVVVNAAINPLTALTGLRNGELLAHASTRALIHVLAAECSCIVRSLPEIGRSTSSKTRERFAPRSLERRVCEVVEKTAANVSSMLQDVRAGRATEIQYIAGYLVRRARQAGVGCGILERLVEMVEGGVKVGVGQGELERWFPEIEGV